MATGPDSKNPNVADMLHTGTTLLASIAGGPLGQATAGLVETVMAPVVKPLADGAQKMLDMTQMSTADMLQHTSTGLLVNMIRNDGTDLASKQRELLGAYIDLGKKPHIAKLMKDASEDPDIAKAAEDQLGFDPNGSPMKLVDRITAMKSDDVDKELDKVKATGDSMLLKGYAAMPKNMLSSMAKVNNSFGDMMHSFMDTVFPNGEFSFESLGKGLMAVMDKMTGVVGKLAGSKDLNVFSPANGGAMANSLGAILPSMGARMPGMSFNDPNGNPMIPGALALARPAPNAGPAAPSPAA